MAGNNVLTITSANFESEVVNSDIPVFIDFWASWCGPCRMVAPTIDALADEYAGKVKIGKVNVDEENALASQFGVRSIPTMILFKNGKVADTTMGAAPKPVLAQFLDKNL